MVLVLVLVLCHVVVVEGLPVYRGNGGCDNSPISDHPD